ncbi:arf-GAP domain and FG repeat-containing protein 2 isoform X1 [Canis lupus baileyi]|uniref:arf-GAP domain and FG repeat-containing protein 2 isoform X1 n=1 Tax=Canis lupus familiaris TaxID=9615 RepID=UPI0006B3C893|nr:arf-GAP domain and FG repeat-containing protein 2 isoform X1 [Canis lupus familiaris]XP_025281797.1 arf-GAP domain and FG repeat-containing protein 2 isoform X1 [Canis lupus dingo]XP_038395194.1 arf-GAP domain and FG repeat-containing protein 2 isoform X1 [Canis lupus familiaris]XP_038523980.1 arf-GAP domain and FG repeat-containing protein 2 isoform X1 [Canis lupus familiaris]|eukprot:XP_013969690.1 arf-GAP domain and FG repeat-containing protein 2 isoform X1 [Canis lupus familiaris]
MVMAAKKGPGPGGGVSGGKAEAEAASEVWCRRVRELGGCSQAGNRHCFECAQRGVTYVDITVGSFVCTTCSGLLRGLNPPHRVKSISMTTFTEPEVVFLQSRGNEVCRKIWLGLFDARTSLIPDSRDPQKVKEFLQEKYEKKRCLAILSQRYVPPDQVKGPAYTKGSASTPIQGSIPEGKPLRTLLGDPVPSLSAAASASSQSICQSQPRTSQPRSSQPPPHSSIKKASTDLLADIGGDPFAAPQVAPAFAAFPAFGGQTPSHGGFANFDAFGSSPGSSAFGSIPPAGQGPFQAQPTATASRMLTGSYSFGSSQVTPFGASPLAPTSQPNSLPDMGSLLGPGVSAGGIPSSVFGVAGQVPALQSAPAGGGGGSTGLAFGAFTNPFTVPATHPQLPSTNPFQPNGLATGSSFGMSSTGPGFPQTVPPTRAFVSTFPPPVFPPQTSMTQQQNGSSFSDLGSAKLGQRQLSQPAGTSTNPFMTGSSSSPFASRPPTTNPFL